MRNKEKLFSIIKARDVQYDGLFVAGADSTKNYCRPICAVEKINENDYHFFMTAAEAEQLGYSPCPLCRPEIAPGMARKDSDLNLANYVARMIEKNCNDEKILESIAKKYGYSLQYINKVFSAEYKVSPLAYLQTSRSLIAKALLRDTNLPILDITKSIGFNNVDSFNEFFEKKYNISPAIFRKEWRDKKEEDDKMNLILSYRPPYDWDRILKFFSGRAIIGVESISNGEYARTVEEITSDGKKIHGWFKVCNRPQNNEIAVTISRNLSLFLPKLLSQIRCLFDLYSDPQEIYQKLSVMNKIRPDLCILGTRVPGSFNAFEMSVRAILGQQVSVKAASTLAARIVQNYGTVIETGINGLTHIFPTPAQIIAMGDEIQNNFGKIGITSARSRTIYELAKAILNNEIDFDSLKPLEEMKKLMTIKGIGKWTANYIAMRTMQWSDAFLETDVGIRNALPEYTINELLMLSETWKPWRSYAILNIWNTLY